MDVLTEGRPAKNKSAAGLYLLLVLVSLAAAVYTQLPALKSAYIIHDDARQHLYWMARFHNPALFTNDIYFQYADYLAPWGYKSLYFLLAFFFNNPVYIGKILGILLYVFSGICIFRLGKSLQDAYVGLTAFALFILFPMHLERFVGGFERAFAYPLLLLFIHYLYHLRIGKCSLLLILQILFYPVMAVLSYALLCAALCFSVEEIRRRYPPQKIAALILAPLLLGVIFLGVKQATKPEFLGDLITKNAMYQDRAFWKDGRDPYLPIKPLTAVIKDKFLFHTSLGFFMLFCAVTCAISLRDKNREETRKYRFLFIFFLVSIALYKLAAVFLFRLYIPERYTDFSLPLIHILLVSSGAGACISACKKRYAKIIGMVLVLGLAGFCHKGSIKQGIGNPVREQRREPLYRFLASLPENTLIAANPFLSDNIKTFSRRKVFITYEQAQHWFTGYTAIIDQRAMDFFKIYYSDSGREAYELCKANGIEYLVIHLSDLSSEFITKGRYLYEPLNRPIARRIAEKKKFFLSSLDEKKILYRLNNDIVIKADAATLLGDK